MSETIEKPPLSVERAKAICSAINSYCYASMGLDTKVLKLPDGVTLLEMAQAAELLSSGAADVKNADGSTTIMMRPDPRLVAAVYCFLHYSPSEEPILQLRTKWGQDRCLALIDMEPREDDAESEE